MGSCLHRSAPGNDFAWWRRLSLSGHSGDSNSRVAVA